MRSAAAFLLLVLIWGSAWLIPASLPHPATFVALALRYAIACAVLACFVAWRGRWNANVATVVRCAVTGLGLLCVPTLLIYLGAQHLPSVVATIALSMVPVLLAMAGRLRLGIAVCGMGGVLFLAGGLGQIAPRDLPWLLCPALAIGVLAVSIPGAEKLVRAVPISTILLVQFAVAAVVYAMAAYWLERHDLRLTGDSWPSIGLDVVAVVLCGYWLFYYVLQQSGAGVASTAQWAQTLMTTCTAAAVLHIRPGWVQFLGAGLIVIALIVLSRNRSTETLIYKITGD